MVLELSQKGYDEPEVIGALNENHMALLFLIDTSNSMDGEPIKNLNEAINRFKDDVCEDSTTRKVLDVAIVEFNSRENLKIVQDFRNIQEMKPINMVVGGGTYMVPAIEMAISMVRERVKIYSQHGIIPYKPWIILISDGKPTDDIKEVAQVVRKRIAEGKMNFFSLGVPGFDSETLHMFSDKVFELKGVKFAGFFNWVTKSMATVSRSAPGTVTKLEKPTDPMIVVI